MNSHSLQHETIQLRALTLNCWGLPLVTKHLDTRIQAIGQTIADLAPDVVGLQEVFREKDRKMIERITSDAGLSFSRYFPSSFLGSGLMILSRYPILSAGFQPYRLNGRPQDLIRSDYYAGKGFGWAVIETPLRPVCVYNTHLIAPYQEIGSDDFFGHRVSQAVELVEHIRQQSDGMPVILLADLNHTPEGIVYPFLKEAAKLHDSFAEINPGNPGVTVSTDIPYVLIHEPERIDYVWYRNGSDTQISVEQASVTFQQVPANFADQIRAYSDHYGVLAILTIKRNGAVPETSSCDPEIIQQVRAALTNAMNQIQKKQPANWFRLASLITALLAITAISPAISINRRGFLLFLVRLAAAILLFGIMVSLSLAIRLPDEVKAYQGILDRLSALKDCQVPE